MPRRQRNRQARRPAAGDRRERHAATAEADTSRRRLPRWLSTAIATVTFWLWQLGTAQAADGSSAQIPGALSWIELQDTRGISVWNYELSLDRGGVTSPGKIMWSFVLDLLWGIYRSCVVVAIWFLDWALSFTWLTTIATPVLAIGDSLQVIVDRFGLAPLFATAAALIAVTWMAKGKWALGIFELFASLVIAALAVGAFADPVEKVAGDSGLIMDTRDVGMGLAAGIANNGNVEGDTEAMRQTVTATMVDTFIRIPTEMINFGTVLDGGACEGAYDDVIRGGPYGSGDDIRNAIEGCDENLGEAAANPGMGQAASALIVSPASALVMIFAIVVAGAVMLAAAFALYQALRLIVTAILAILPGSARGSLFQTVSDLTMALVTLVFAVVFCSSYLIFIQGLFATNSGGSQNVMATFFLVDVMLVIGIVLFWKGRKKLRRAADRLAAALATRPGAGPTALPSKQKMSPTDLYYKGRMAAQVGGAAGRGVGALGRGALAAGRGLNNGAGALGGWIGRNLGAPAAAGAAAGAGGAGGALQLLAGPGGAGPTRGGGGPGGFGGPGGGGGAAGAVRQRVASSRGARKVGGRLLAIGGQAAAAYLTGGASAALQAGGQAATAAAAIQTVKSARRVALAGSLATKALPAGSSASSTSGPLALTAGRATGGDPSAPAAAASGAAAGAAAGSSRAQRALPPSASQAGSTAQGGAAATSSPGGAPGPSPRATGAKSAAAKTATGATATGATATDATATGAAATGATTAAAKTAGVQPAGARTSATSAPRAAGATAQASTTGSTSSAQPASAPATQAATSKPTPARPAPASAVSGEVVAAPAKKPASSDDRAARLRAELAARRAATSHVQRATGRPPEPSLDSPTD